MAIIAAHSAARSAALYQKTREGVMLSEVQRLLDSLLPDGGATATQRIISLERLYRVSMLCAEAAQLRFVMRE